MFLDFAEDQARRRRSMFMADWSERLDAFLSFNDREVLANAGRIGAEEARRIAHERFADFDTARREAEDAVAEADHVEEMLRLTEEWKPRAK
jgi:hypothetical protein